MITRVVPGSRCIIDGGRVVLGLLGRKHRPARGDDSDQADQPVQQDRGQRRRGSIRDQCEDQGGLHHADPAGYPRQP
ncbi:MAG: hypothetical protein M3Y73_02845 [Actinomycetota bacterium]|nr:hypothetical protein [Actinomycetota bacterium]